MKELRDKQRLKRYLYSYLSLLILLIVAFLLGRGAYSIFSKERESAQVLKDLEAKNAALALRQESLKEDIASLNTEEGIIEEIRRKYNVTRPGEHLAIVLEDKKLATTTEPTPMEKLKLGWEWFLDLWGR